MAEGLETYKRKKKYLVCVDSDGCVMDTMDSKHTRCFGPCLVEEWGLSEWRDAILKDWNEMNLYSMTRGINRFKGLVKMLRKINEAYAKIKDIEVLEQWVEESPELSEAALADAIREQDSVILKKALVWSETVNKKDKELLFREKRSFEGVKEALDAAALQADIAVVSSANYHAALEEWKENHLLEYADIFLAQDAGSKSYCMGELLKKGYEREQILMIGDAPGDYEAARENGIYFYPILVRKETESWEEFRKTGLERFVQGSYGGIYQKERIDIFLNNLKGQE